MANYASFYKLEGSWRTTLSAGNNFTLFKDHVTSIFSVRPISLYRSFRA